MSDEGTVVFDAGGASERYRPSSRIGRYLLLEPIGEGGMGVVWLGIDENGAKVVLKLMPVDLSTPRERVERFMREGRILTTLRHSSICRIHEINEAPGTLYIAMEYVEGVPLDRLMRFVNDPTIVTPAGRRSGERVELTTLIETITRTGYEPAPAAGVTAGAGARRLPLQQALALVLEICRALRFAHERGVLHRDVKPSNIMIRPDGRPVLMDFGIAKYAEGAEATLTRTGRVFGTIAYMAPEQAQSAHDVDERADVYGIGAVMYHLVTGKRHFLSSGDLVRDIRRLKDYEPIRPRLHSRDIDPDLEAVMLKALEADRARRYRSVRALAEDIRRYHGDEPVTAKRATPLYVLKKKVRKHRRTLVYGAALVAIAAMLGAYHAVDYYRRWGKWERVTGWDFRRGAAPPSELRFVGTDLRPAAPWKSDSQGLVLDKAGETCWLRETVPGDVRVVVTLSYDRDPDGFELIINGADDSLPTYSFVPRGYSCQFGGYFGSLAFISVNETPAVAKLNDFAHCRAGVNEPVELMFERRGRDLRLFIDGEEAVTVRDLVPFEGAPFSRIGFRCYATTLHVRSLDVYRYALPRSVSPLVAGGALLAAGRPRAAIETFLHVADDHPEDDLGARALLRAFAAAGALDSMSRCVVRDSLAHLFVSRHPRSRYLRTLREEQLVDLWDRKEYESVLRRLPEHCGRYRGTNIAQRIVPTAPALIKRRLLPYLAELGRVLALSLDTLGLDNLEVLRGCDLLRLSFRENYAVRDVGPLSSMRRLMWLDCSYNAIEVLSPLAGMPLFSLDIASNRVRDLSTVEGMPLRLLRAENNFIEDLSPLRGMRLKSLDVGGNLVSDLSPLRGMPLTRLDVSSDSLRDLRPLAGMALTELECGTGHISDLSPLEGMPLRRLTVFYNDIENLTPLKGMPLRYLNVAANPVRDLTPLRDLPLQSLNITNLPIHDLEPLRGLSLRTLACLHNDIRSLEPLAGMPLRGLSCANCRIERLPAFAAGTLKRLDVSGNRIHSLKPLRGLALEALTCCRNPLTSLEGIDGMPLEELEMDELDNGGAVVDLSVLRTMPLRRFECMGTRVRSLDPLAEAPLELVNCQGSGLRSLGPLLARPPAVFHFYDESLPLAELERIDSAWAEDSGTVHLSRTARLYRLVRTGQWEALREPATRFDGRDYLYIPIHLDCAASLELAGRAGGRLAVPNSDAEARFLSRLCDWSSQRIGAVLREGRWRDADGAAIEGDQLWFRAGRKIDYAAGDSANLAIDHRGLVRMASPPARLPFCIEWGEEGAGQSPDSNAAATARHAPSPRSYELAEL